MWFSDGIAAKKYFEQEKGNSTCCCPWIQIMIEAVYKLNMFENEHTIYSLAINYHFVMSMHTSRKPAKLHNYSNEGRQNCFLCSWYMYIYIMEEAGMDRS